MNEKYKNIIPKFDVGIARELFISIEKSSDIREKALAIQKIISEVELFYYKYITSLLDKIEVMENNSGLILAEIMLLRKDMDEIKKERCNIT